MPSKSHILEELEVDAKELRWAFLLTFLTGLGLVASVVLLLFGFSGYWLAAMYVLSFVAGGYPALLGSIATLKEKKLDIDLLMLLAALAAAGVGEARDGAILLFLFSLAGALEHYAMGNTKRSVAALMNMRPDEAQKQLEDGTTVRVAVEELALGDMVIVKPGERMPVDGVIRLGAGAIDQSPITGESVPVDKGVGEPVFAGSVNQNAVLTIEVTALAGQSTLARMITLVTEAQSKRSPSESFSDWFGQRYTFVVLGGSILALVVFLFMDMPTADALYKAATLLVVASPCAIVISVPAAVLSAIASAARHGVLFKGGAALEEFGMVKTIAFDKTGTLTSGKMSVVRVKAFSGSEGDLLALLGGLEAQSDHPLARSVMAYLAKKGILPKVLTEVTATVGKGIVARDGASTVWVGNRALVATHGAKLTEVEEAALAIAEGEGETPLVVGRGTTVCGFVSLADTVRPEAEAALLRLRASGVQRCVMLTGDSPRVAAAIGAKLGLGEKEIYGGLMPEDKVTRVEDLRRQHKVAFVGDGVNDAAALATAQVGVAMGVAGTDAALEAADVALLSDDLRKLAYAYTLSRKTDLVIKQNLIFACGIMAVMVVVTLFGNLPLPLGVIGHEGGTLLVVANGLRLLFVRDHTGSA
jgi:Zn2+/Cd2+-exporting ATPase